MISEPYTSLPVPPVSFCFISWWILPLIDLCRWRCLARAGHDSKKVHGESSIRSNRYDRFPQKNRTINCAKVEVNAGTSTSATIDRVSPGCVLKGARTPMQSSCCNSFDRSPASDGIDQSFAILVKQLKPATNLPEISQSFERKGMPFNSKVESRRYLANVYSQVLQPQPNTDDIPLQRVWHK